MNKHKEFIKNAYNGKLGLTMCDNWKEEILKVYPEFKKKEYILNNWYKQKCSEGSFILSCFQGFYTRDYGFNASGDWSCSLGHAWLTSDSKIVTLATEEEVFQELKKEAVKRGFKEGVHFTTYNNNNPKNSRKADGELVMGWRGRKYALHFKNSRGLIFADGKWGEIIPNTITKAEAEAQLGKTIID